MHAPPLTRCGPVRGSWDRLVARVLGPDWSLRHGTNRVLALPDGTGLRAQGWLLAVSATTTSAGMVLARTAEVLAARRCPFTFAATISAVRTLNAHDADPAVAARFLIVYPKTDDEVPELAAELDEATRGLPGPAITSARPVREDSLVHYRYAAFVPMRRLADHGGYEQVVYTPDGVAVPDRPELWLPPWTPDPIGATPSVAPAVLGDRFVAYGTGDRFRAFDRHTGADVVVRRGRAHIDETPGGDIRDRLRREAAMLAMLGPTGVVPDLVTLLERPHHTLLVTSAVDGTPLRDHLCELRFTHTGTELATRVHDLAVRLTALLATVHDEGVVLRDLSPATVLVEHDGRLRLTGLAMAAFAGSDAVGAGPCGFAAPEQRASAAVPTPAQPTADLFSLGAMLFFLAVGAEPVLAKEFPARGAQGRLRRWLDGAAADDPLVNHYRALILDLTADDPAHRCRLDVAGARLAKRVVVPAPPTDAPAPAEIAEIADRMLHDSVDYLLAGMAGPGADRLWPGDPRADPTDVHCGSAGVLAALVRAMPHVKDVALADAVQRVAWWTADRCAEEPTVLPGMHFGRAGVVWALLDCAITLDDKRLRDRALDLGAELPVAGPIPGVSHGIAGTGLTALHCWRRTGDTAFLGKAVRCAEHLVTTVDGVPERYGFAEGTAGIVTFLLDCGIATGDDRYLTAAERAADRLCALAVPTANGARWPSGPTETTPSSTHCRGGAGIGSFLVRMAAVTGDPRHLAAAHAAAIAVRPTNGCCRRRPATASRAASTSCSTLPRRPARRGTAKPRGTVSPRCGHAPRTGTATRSSATTPDAPRPRVTTRVSPGCSPRSSGCGTAARGCGCRRYPANYDLCRAFRDHRPLLPRLITRVR